MNTHTLSRAAESQGLDFGVLTRLSRVIEQPIGVGVDARSIECGGHVVVDTFGHPCADAAAFRAEVAVAEESRIRGVRRACAPRGHS